RSGAFVESRHAHCLRRRSSRLPGRRVLRPAAGGARMRRMTAPAIAGPCPECGVDNAPDHNYCKHCGTPLRAIDVERELGTGFAERTRDRCLQLLKADPDNASAHYNLGLAYYHLSQIGNAIRCFER